MKKIILFFFCALCFAPSALATNTDDNTVDYSTVDAPYIALEANDLGDGSVHLNWNTAYFESMQDFLYWKVVHSDNNPELIYPEDGYIFYDTNPEADSYIDINTDNGTNYYRVCGITSTMTRYCSNVVEVEIERTETVSSNGYKNIISDNDLKLKLSREENGNKLTWDAKEYNNFVYWKLVRSKDNANPSYPEDGYIFYSNYAETNEYLDESPTSLPVYYRLCAITSDRLRYCSNVIYFDPENIADSEQAVCTTDYNPVCGTNGKTYSNECNAAADSAEIEHTGKCSSPENEKEDFSDTEKSQYQKAIQYVKNKKIVEGYGDGTYRPENKINRAEFTKILILAVYSQADSEDCNKDIFKFTDTAKNEWYAPYLCLAKREGVISGYGNGTFQPSSEINLAEALKIVLLTYGVELPEAQGEWYAPYWSYALKNKIIPESVTSVNQKINRGEMAEIIYNLENE